MGLLSELLLPGGIIHILVPDVTPMLKSPKQYNNIENLSPEKWKSMAPLQHINGFTPKSLKLFAAKFGLKPIHRHSLLIELGRGPIKSFLAWLAYPYRNINTKTFQKV